MGDLSFSLSLFNSTVALNLWELEHLSLISPPLLHFSLGDGRQRAGGQDTLGWAAFRQNWVQSCMNGKWNRGQKKKIQSHPPTRPPGSLRAAAQTHRQKSLAGGEENGSINNLQHKTLMSHFSRGVDPHRALCYTEILSFKVTASVVSLFFHCLMFNNSNKHTLAGDKYEHRSWKNTNFQPKRWWKHNFWDRKYKLRNVIGWLRWWLTGASQGSHTNNHLIVFGWEDLACRIGPYVLDH